ncbi:Hypothetical protein A7982_02670 [Minicystis rosea]|nr:Hypothetical protein A7982_02670 [Minicystis rosea]
MQRGKVQLERRDAHVSASVGAVKKDTATTERHTGGATRIAATLAR